MSEDAAYQNAQHDSDKKNARVELKRALRHVMTEVLNDDTELYKQFVDNPDFRKWMTSTVFTLTYDRPDATPPVV